MALIFRVTRYSCKILARILYLSRSQFWLLPSLGVTFFEKKIKEIADFLFQYENGGHSYFVRQSIKLLLNEMETAWKMLISN